MLKFTSTRYSSPEKIVMARENGRRHAPDRAYAYQYAADAKLSFAQAAQRLAAGGPVLYAIRLADRLIKIGWTSDLYGRWRQLICTDHAEEFLAFTFGSRADETELHRRLTEHVARGNEYYHPHAEVLDVVNSWRAEFGRGPVS